MAGARKALAGALRVLLLLAVVLGAGWFVLSLNYDDELPRVQANEGIEAAGPLMDIAQQKYAATGRIPRLNELTGVPFRARKHVADIGVADDLTITVTYQGRREIAGKTLRLMPYADKGGSLRWRCDLPDIDPRWWPDYCRQTPKP